VGTEHWWNESDRRKRKYSERNLPLGPPLIAQVLGWDLKPGLRGERPAADILNHGAVTGKGS